MMKIKTGIFCLLILLCHGSGLEAGFVVSEDYSNFEYRLNREFGSLLFNDFGKVVASPIKWQGNDFLCFSLLSGGIFLFSLADDDIRNWVDDNRTNTSEDISGFFSILGHGAFTAGLGGTLYIAGELMDKKGLRKTALLSLESWLISGVIVNAFKIVVGRQRPSQNNSCYNFRPFSLRSGNHSFPSGHSSTAFSVAAVIDSQSDSIFLDISAYTLAAAAALSRIHDSKHWLSDTAAGSVLGYFVGKMVSGIHSDKPESNSRLTISLIPGKSSITLSFSF